MPDLPLLWSGIIAFGVFMYVLLDSSISASASCFRSPRAGPSGT